MERLDKLLAGTGRWSRKEVKELVRTGRVRVNGVLAGKPEDKCDPESEFTVDGEQVFCGKLVYIMLHKPAGVLSATEDARQKTVIDLLPEHLRRRGLFPPRGGKLHSGGACDRQRRNGSVGAESRPCARCYYAGWRADRRAGGRVPVLHAA